MPFFQERLPHCNEIGIIVGESPNRSAPDWRQSLKNRAVQLEVFVPAIISRMEQARNFAGERIDTRDVGTFMSVAVETGVCEIIHTR